MKNLKRTFFILFAASISASFFSCETDDNAVIPAFTGPTQTIADIAIDDNRTDSLVVALSQANFIPKFQQEGNYTVFAPTNQAFVNLLASNSSWNRIADIDATTLTNVLFYHIIGNNIKSSDLTDSTFLATLNVQGGVNKEKTILEIDVNALGVTVNNNARVVTADIEATNGILHIIDEVLIPQNIIQLAINDERFSTFVSALQLSTDTLSVVLSGTGPFTVFVPTNNAFQKLLDANPTWNSLNDIPKSTLNTVLKYHVVSGINAQSNGIFQSQTLNTLNNNNLTVDLSNGMQLITTSTNQAAVNIVIADMQGTNGVIHSVEEVLLP